MTVRVYSSSWANRYQDEIASAGGDLHGLGEPAGDGAAVLFRAPGFREDELPTILETHPDVRWIHTIGAGVDRFIHHVPESIVVTRAPGPGGPPVAEFAFTALLMLLRRVPELFAAQLERRWEKLESRQFGDVGVAILGWGPIAREIAWRCGALHMDVQVIRRRPDAAGDPPQHASTALRAIAVESDALVVACALTADTHRIVDTHVLEALGPTGVVVNVGRGGLVDQDALIRLLHDGRLGGAVLDVTDPEPLPRDHPLWSAPRCLVTPHLAAHAGDFYDAAMAVFFDNLRRFDRGEPLLHIVNRTVGY